MKRCLRCNRKLYVINYHYDCECGMSGSLTTKGTVVVHSLTGVADGVIYWGIGSGCCFIQGVDNALPWFPFTITKEQLDKYLILL